jgi:O-antigen/teichoic acid export membrane protein
MNALGLGGKMMSVGLSLFLLVYVFHELYGFFVGVILAEFIGSIILFGWFFKKYKITPKKNSRELNLRLLKFGIPLLFSELSFLSMSNADKYIIVALYGETLLGLYSVGYALASYIGNILMFSLSYAIVPIYVEIYEKDGKERTEEFLKKSMHYLIIAVIPMALGYFAISKELFLTLASEKYSAAATFSPIILIGLFFLAMNSILNAGLYLQRKTMVMLLIMAIATILNIILNFILLPPFGIMGAAVAALITCLSVTILTACISFKYINVEIELSHVLYYLMLSLLMYYLVGQIETSKIWVNLVLKIIAGIFIVGIGVLYREKEFLKRIKEAF